MKTIAFFNNKGGVGKTSLVYHLAWIFGECDHRVIAVDLDPQANLSGMFLDEDELFSRLQQKGEKPTIDGDIAPLFGGTGDIAISPHVEEIDERIGLLPGDLMLSKREDELSAQWPKCLEGDPRAFRVTTAFARLMASAGEKFRADLVLVDVGPNLGAINRAALIASDYVIVPLAPDLFSLQGLRNVGPTLKMWRDMWKERKQKKPSDLQIDLPTGGMEPLGYVIMRHTIRLSRPVAAFEAWIERMPSEYAEAVIGKKTASAKKDKDPHCLAHLKDYRSLMPMAQEAKKPMFMLKPADGVFGAHQHAVQDCYKDFQELAKKLTNASKKESSRR